MRGKCSSTWWWKSRQQSWRRNASGPRRAAAAPRAARGETQPKWRYGERREVRSRAERVVVVGVVAHRRVRKLSSARRAARSPPARRVGDLLLEPERGERRDAGPWRAPRAAAAARAARRAPRGAALEPGAVEGREDRVRLAAWVPIADVVDGVQARVRAHARRPARARRCDPFAAAPRERARRRALK